MTQAETDAVAIRIQQRIQRRILRAMARRELEIDGIYRDAAATIRRELRATGFTEVQVEQVIRRAFDQAAERVIPKVEAGLRQAASEGNEAAKEQYRRIFGQDPIIAGTAGAAEVAASGPFGSGSRRSVLRLVSPPSESEDS